MPMAENNGVSKFLQSISVFVASILPILQLFFSQFSVAFDHIFLAKDYFVGISVLTLLLSYVCIIAYLNRPYVELLLPLPGARKRNQALQNYRSKRNDILEEMNKSRDHDYKKYTRLHNALLQLEQPRAPYKINQDNILSHLVTFTVVTAMLFIVSAFVGGAIFSVVQSLSYMVLIPSIALVLTIYRRNSINQTEWRNNRRNRAQKAIKLATDSNCFGVLPQVKFVEQFESSGFPQTYHVVATYKQKTYEIITDTNADYMERFYQRDQ